MGQTLLKEAGASTLSKSGKRWKGILAVAGQGSSGFYSESVLRDFGPNALPPGSHAYVDHPTDEKPNRSPKDLIGVYPDGARYEEGVGLVGELEVLPHWADFVEAVAPHTGLSIYMMGETDEEGNVTGLFANKFNSVDLVSYAGLESSGLVEKLYESARAASDPKPAAASAEDQRKKEAMEKWEEAIAEIRTLVTTSITESKAAIAAAEAAKTKAEADAQAALDAVADKVKEALAAFKQKAEAIEAAELLPEQAAPILKAAEAGEDITEKLAEAVAVKAAFKTLSESNEGGTFIRSSESATAAASDALPKGW